MTLDSPILSQPSVTAFCQIEAAVAAIVTAGAESRPAANSGGYAEQSELAGLITSFAEHIAAEAARSTR
jgi:hypothetical protein